MYVASASAAGTRRPAFKRVGRGRKAFVSIRGLTQDLLAPEAPPSSTAPEAEPPPANETVLPNEIALQNEEVLPSQTAPPDEVVMAGMLPGECADGRCSKLWVRAAHSSSSSSMMGLTEPRLQCSMKPA
jgi:hypothetical protein